MINIEQQYRTFPDPLITTREDEGRAEPSVSELMREITTLRGEKNRLIISNEALQAQVGILSGSNNLLKEFMLGSVHTLKNQFAAIKGYAELGMRAKDVGTALSMFKKSYELLSPLGSNLVTFPEQLKTCGELNKAPMDIVSSIRESFSANVEMARLNPKMKDLHLQIRCPEDRLEIIGDDKALREAVFENLAKNAIEAMEKSPVKILGVSIEAGNTYVQIVVADTGPGIPSKILPNIFKRGVSTKQHNGGNGLGLYHAKSIVEAHQGTIDAKNLPGGGAIFAVCLPLAGFKFS